LGNDRLDSQVSARLLRRALAVQGSPERLARTLGVPVSELARWLGAQSFPPQAVFEKILDVVLDSLDGRPAPASERAPDASRPRILVADQPAACGMIAGILGGEFELVPVHTLAEALDILQSGAVLERGIDAIVCGQHFEGSQMLRFLECVKAYKATSAIPFVGYRAFQTQLSEGALAAMREACEALGAVAYVDLPEHEGRSGKEAAAVEFRDAVRAAVRLPRAAASLRILVVDDNADAAHTMAALLRMAGHEVLKADNGDEALRLAREQPPAAAVLDIGMQGMSGYTLAERIRAEPWGRTVILVAVTGWGSAQDVARAHAAGFDHHFTKPVDLDRVLAILRKIAT